MFLSDQVFSLRGVSITPFRSNSASVLLSRLASDDSYIPTFHPPRQTGCTQQAIHFPASNYLLSQMAFLAKGVSYDIANSASSLLVIKIYKFTNNMEENWAICNELETPPVPLSVADSLLLKKTHLLAPFGVGGGGGSPASLTLSYRNPLPNPCHVRLLLSPPGVLPLAGIAGLNICLFSSDNY